MLETAIRSYRMKSSWSAEVILELLLDFWTPHRVMSIKIEIVLHHGVIAIYNFELDITTGQLLTEATLIWEGWDKRFTEGPHV